MVDAVSRRKIFNLLVAYMKADIKSVDFSSMGFKYINKKDATLTELFYRMEKDRNTYYNHYITVIKEDWHYYVQMSTFLLSDRELEVFHYYDPQSSGYDNWRIFFWCFVVPLTVYVFWGVMSPMFFLYLSLPFLVVVFLLKDFVANEIGKEHNCFYGKKVSDCWPYQCEADFEADFLEFSEADDIPLDRPDLTGKVHKVSKEQFRGAHGGISAMPDEF